MQNLLNRLLCDYAREAAQHGNATQEGNYRKANASHDNLMRVLSEIRNFADEGRAALLKLVNHKDESVRCWAATHSLEHDEDRAVKALKELSKGSGPVSFNAEMVLSEWEKGRLKIPK